MGKAGGGLSGSSAGGVTGVTGNTGGGNGSSGGASGGGGGNDLQLLLTDTIVEMIQDEVTLQLHMKINDLFEDLDIAHLDKVP